ncbi:FkbM family methyltransferase [Paracoccus sp. p3-h83]|uniref:FkbM family methyltransferase n=1 Tax=Paracoccus sp. p3-h83 TaxID=3342805 RepID=UPI0035BB2F70
MVDAKVERLRLLHELVAPTPLTRILDVGANPVNPPPYALMHKAGLCEIWGFEPAPEAFEKLQVTKGPREHYIRAAVGDGKDAVLRLFAVDGFNSTLDANSGFVERYLGFFRQALRQVGQLPFNTQRLDDLTDLPTPDLLKIDIQGGETKVFDHGARTLAGTGAIITEVAFVPLYDQQPLIGDQMASLRKQGFEFHKMLFTKSHALRSRLGERLDPSMMASQAVDGDAVFLRRDMILRKSTPADVEAVKHLALLADSVLGSLDVVLRCLTILDDHIGLDRRLLAAYLAKVNPKPAAAAQG